MKKSRGSDRFGSIDDPSIGAGFDDSEDPLNPAIPKAPLVPRDISRMPNAALPKWSQRPDSGELETASGAPVRIQFDAQRPPGATPSTYASAAKPPHSQSFVGESMPSMAIVHIEVPESEFSLPAPASKASQPKQEAPVAEEVRTPVDFEPPAVTRKPAVSWAVVLLGLLVLIVAMLGGAWLAGLLE